MTGSSEPNLNRSESDPFLHLHKMSTTAGLGSGDYVAINGTAVVCLLLGAASAFVLFDSHVFLLFPFFGIVTGILAWNQISKSNGTQTGREVAAIGLLLAVGFGGYAGVMGVYNTVKSHSDEQQVVSQVKKLGELLKSEDYPDAYALFDSQFHKHVSKTDFETGWRRMSASPILGKVQSIDWNELLVFTVDPVNESRLASGMMLFKLKPAEPLRINMILRNEEGNWLIDQIPQIFSTETAPARQSVKQNSNNSKPLPFIGPPKPQG
jgi:hypothetical protein